jgi:hypothetical protein
MTSRQDQRGFWAVLTLAVALGSFLRLYLLRDQILLDDEWHGIQAVIGKSYGEILTSFNPVDNSSPPLNLYSLFLYRTFGWSELGLRLPTLIAGLSSLVLFPLIVRHSLGARAAGLFGLLLAVSPFLIFYSRYARAYSIVVLLGFASVFWFYRWLASGERKYRVGYLLAGALAIYAHACAIPAVVAPLALGLAVRSLPRLEKWTPEITERSPGAWSILRLASAMAVVFSIELWPALAHRSQLPWGKGALKLESFVSAAKLISGTDHLALSLLVIALAAAGHVWLLRRKPLLGWIFTAVIVGNLAFIGISRPVEIESAAVLLRYTIVAVPLTLLTAAVALDRGLEFLDRRIPARLHPRLLTGMAAVVLVLVLLLSGPLVVTYATPNNFTNHSAFQGSYARPTWKRSDARHVLPAFEIVREKVPPFYEWLAAQPGVEAITEYPFDVCNYNNLLYYYQHVHGKRVFAGYTTEPALRGYAFAPDAKGEEFGFGTLTADKILTPLETNDRLHLRTMAQVSDEKTLRDGPSDYIALHKFLMVLKFRIDRIDTSPVFYRAVELLAERYRRWFGPPVFEDASLIVFNVRSRSQAR